MTDNLYSADKVKKLEEEVLRLEKMVNQSVAKETNRQREIEAYEEYEKFRDEAMAQIGHDM